ncbi:MAG: hypothetical protein GXP55_22730 [Deltaproteobacteria bacterium]|nr:hypothetical protein [Deltaproteobacteria bacterium]
MTAPRHLRRRLLRGLAIAGVLLAVVAVRVVVSSRAELRQGVALEQAEDVDAAIVHYRRAARWYAPLSPYPGEALDRLERIGAAAERDMDVDRALSAYRAMRGAILSTRSFYTPSPERLGRADQHIARLMSELPAPPIDAGKSTEELYREHLALLEGVHRPKLPFALMALFGFGLWVGGAFTFATRAIDEEDRLVRPQALRWALVVLVGFALFALGLAFA